MRSLIVAAVVALGALAAYVRAADAPQTSTNNSLVFAQSASERDIVFTTPRPGCIGNAYYCATELHFNGKWSGVKLCRAKQCVAYEEVFREERH